MPTHPEGVAAGGKYAYAVFLSFADDQTDFAHVLTERLGEVLGGTDRVYNYQRQPLTMTTSDPKLRDMLREEMDRSASVVMIWSKGHSESPYCILESINAEIAKADGGKACLAVLRDKTPLSPPWNETMQVMGEASLPSVVAATVIERLGAAIKPYIPPENGDFLRRSHEPAHEVWGKGGKCPTEANAQMQECLRSSNYALATSLGIAEQFARMGDVAHSLARVRRAAEKAAKYVEKGTAEQGGHVVDLVAEVQRLLDLFNDRRLTRAADDSERLRVLRNYLDRHAEPRWKDSARLCRSLEEVISMAPDPADEEARKLLDKIGLLAGTYCVVLTDVLQKRARLNDRHGAYVSTKIACSGYHLRECVEAFTSTSVPYLRRGG